MCAAKRHRDVLLSPHQVVEVLHTIRSVEGLTGNITKTLELVGYRNISPVDATSKTCSLDIQGVKLRTFMYEVLYLSLSLSSPGCLLSLTSFCCLLNNSQVSTGSASCCVHRLSSRGFGHRSCVNSLIKQRSVNKIVGQTWSHTTGLASHEFFKNITNTATGVCEYHHDLVDSGFHHGSYSVAKSHSLSHKTLIGHGKYLRHCTLESIYKSLVSIKYLSGCDLSNVHTIAMKHAIRKVLSSFEELCRKNGRGLTLLHSKQSLLNNIPRHRPKNIAKGNSSSAFSHTRRDVHTSHVHGVFCCLERREYLAVHIAGSGSPVCPISGGTLKAFPRGIASAAGQLNEVSKQAGLRETAHILKLFLVYTNGTCTELAKPRVLRNHLLSSHTLCDELRQNLLEVGKNIICHLHRRQNLFNIGNITFRLCSYKVILRPHAPCIIYRMGIFSGLSSL